ncbi:hypothetical protein NON00_02380 [Roseomonas sp. GC11]|uniref:hypothetical protein n=1 Tax=Roseomonas sp. GC11 TaxID=2950546 RepID=UPI00210909F7|nr:hypothetical protein [Roseomonas sp. GC11]MCQ4158774.1 hypothetical protein [Roseomonas sp. GC11]
MTTVLQIERRFRRIAAQAKEQVRALQEACPHPEVAHWRGYHSSGTPTNPRRICLQCKLEERGSWWSNEIGWRCEEGDTKLGGAPFLRPLDDAEDFYALRLPQDIDP